MVILWVVARVGSISFCFHWILLPQVGSGVGEGEICDICFQRGNRRSCHHLPPLWYYTFTLSLFHTFTFILITMIFLSINPYLRISFK